MDIDRFFLETLDDLEARAVWGASEYSLLRASALLRELLIDAHPLVTSANRGRDVHLRFTARAAPDGNHGFQVWLGIDPDDPVEGAQGTGGIVDLAVPQLLALPMVFLPAATLTVYDLITLGANVLGGVHHAPAKRAHHQAIGDFPVRIAHGRTPIELVCLVPIAKVFLDGVEPLRSRVRAELPDLPPDPEGRIVIGSA